MKKTILISVVLVAASSAYANKQESDETPPAGSYEMSDQQMGEPLDQICIAKPLVSETYDSKDNMIVVATDDGGQAFLHLTGECNSMALMFADTASGGDDGCVGIGDEITFSSNGGTARTCKIAAIHNWLEEPAEDPFYEY